jgi:signal transduction histidine kinase
VSGAGARDELLRRVARALHDDVAQALVAVQINLDLCAGTPDGPALRERLAQTRATVQEALASVRRLTDAVAPYQGEP